MRFLIAFKFSPEDKLQLHKQGSELFASRTLFHARYMPDVEGAIVVYALIHYIEWTRLKMDYNKSKDCPDEDEVIYGSLQERDRLSNNQLLRLNQISADAIRRYVTMMFLLTIEYASRA